MIRLLKMEYTLDCGLNRLCWRSHDDHTHTHTCGVWDNCQTHSSGRYRRGCALAQSPQTSREMATRRATRRTRRKRADTWRDMVYQRTRDHASFVSHVWVLACV